MAFLCDPGKVVFFRDLYVSGSANVGVNSRARVSGAPPVMTTPPEKALKQEAAGNEGAVGPSLRRMRRRAGAALFSWYAFTGSRAVADKRPQGKPGRLPCSCEAIFLSLEGFPLGMSDYHWVGTTLRRMRRRAVAACFPVKNAYTRSRAVADKRPKR